MVDIIWSETMSSYARKGVEKVVSAPAVDLATDRLVGVEAIARFRGEDVQRTRYLVRIGAIPFYREGRIIVASKAALREDHLRQATRGAST
jgi:hypothetical protein